MSRRALVERTTERDLALHDLAKVTAERDRLAAELAAARTDAAQWKAVAAAQLDRNADLAARPPIEVIVQGRDVLTAVEQHLDFALYELEMGELP